MDAFAVSTELLYHQNRHYYISKGDYKLDMWAELKKRWLIFGVLLTILLAVISPHVGATGGPLHSEYLWYAPLSFVYFSAGCRSRVGDMVGDGWVTACLLSVAHAHLIAPAICATLAIMADDAGLHKTLVKGALVSCAGGPCAWLSVGVGGERAPPSALLANYLASLLATPLILFVICGRAPIPAIGPSLWSFLCIFPPFIIGVLYTRFHSRRCSVSKDCMHCLNSATTKQCEQTRNTKYILGARVCALMLLYMDSCERLREAEGSLNLADFLGTMAFAVVYVVSSTLCCLLYARLVGADGAATVAVCGVPKELPAGWWAVCGWGSTVPRVLLTPAHALVLAALAH